MSPILHALFARPFGSEFMRQRGRIITSLCDIDRLIIDANGYMVIGADGLPKMVGERMDYPKEHRRVSFDRKHKFEIGIINQLNKHDSLSASDLVCHTGYSLGTVKDRINKMFDCGIIFKNGTTKRGNRTSLAYSINHKFAGKSYKEIVEKMSLADDLEQAIKDGMDSEGWDG